MQMRMPLAKIAAVSVVANLVAAPRMCSGSWPLSTFCTRSGTTCDIASLTLPLMMSRSRSARFSPMPTQLNGPHDGVRQAVLFPCALREIFGRQLLEAVGRARRRAASLRAFGSRIFRGALEDHAGRHHRDLLQLGVRWAWIAASKAAAVMRSFSASRS